MAGIWVAELIISDAVGRKINGKHGIAEDEARSALVGVRGLRYSEKLNEKNEVKYLVKTTAYGKAAMAVLYREGVEGDDRYRLATIFHTPQA